MPLFSLRKSIGRLLAGLFLGALGVLALAVLLTLLIKLSLVVFINLAYCLGFLLLVTAIPCLIVYLAWQLITRLREHQLEVKLLLPALTVLAGASSGVWLLFPPSLMAILITGGAWTGWLLVLGYPYWWHWRQLQNYHRRAAAGQLLES